MRWRGIAPRRCCSKETISFTPILRRQKPDAVSDEPEPVGLTQVAPVLTGRGRLAIFPAMSGIGLTVATTTTTPAAGVPGGRARLLRRIARTRRTQPANDWDFSLHFPT